MFHIFENWHKSYIQILQFKIVTIIFVRYLHRIAFCYLRGNRHRAHSETIHSSLHITAQNTTFSGTFSRMNICVSLFELKWNMLWRGGGGGGGGGLQLVMIRQHWFSWLPCSEPTIAKINNENVVLRNMIAVYYNELTGLFVIWCMSLWYYSIFDESYWLLLMAWHLFRTRKFASMTIT